MTGRSGSSNAFWWALIGFLVGVAATLGAFIYIGAGARDPEVATAHSAPVARTPARKSVKSAARATAAEPPTSDEQVAEDAAAAGMTSRARTSQ